MYQVGDKVVYGVHGVCQVVDAVERTVDRKRTVYLTLVPVGQESTKYFVPTHNPAAMAKVRPMLSREELDALLRSDDARRDSWIADENQRKQTYRELIGSGDRSRLVSMVHTLYRHKAAQAAAGRRCHLCDENFLRDAERLLSGEFSVILNMGSDQVRQYVRSLLNEKREPT